MSWKTKKFWLTGFGRIDLVVFLLVTPHVQGYGSNKSPIQTSPGARAGSASTQHFSKPVKCLASLHCTTLEDFREKCLAKQRAPGKKPLTEDEQVQVAKHLLSEALEIGKKAVQNGQSNKTETTFGYDHSLDHPRLVLGGMNAECLKRAVEEAVKENDRNRRSDPDAPPSSFYLFLDFAGFFDPQPQPELTRTSLKAGTAMKAPAPSPKPMPVSSPQQKEASPPAQGSQKVRGLQKQENPDSPEEPEGSEESTPSPSLGSRSLRNRNVSPVSQDPGTLPGATGDTLSGHSSQNIQYAQNQGTNHITSSQDKGPQGSQGPQWSDNAQGVPVSEIPLSEIPSQGSVQAKEVLTQEPPPVLSGASSVSQAPLTPEVIQPYPQQPQEEALTKTQPFYNASETPTEGSSSGNPSIPVPGYPLCTLLPNSPLLYPGFQGAQNAQRYGGQGPFKNPIPPALASQGAETPESSPVLSSRPGSIEEIFRRPPRTQVLPHNSMPRALIAQGAETPESSPVLSPRPGSIEEIFRRPLQESPLTHSKPSEQRLQTSGPGALEKSGRPVPLSIENLFKNKGHSQGSHHSSFPSKNTKKPSPLSPAQNVKNPQEGSQLPPPPSGF